MLNVLHGNGDHTPDSSWAGKRHLFDLTAGARVLLPKASTMPDDFEFEFQLVSINSNSVEFRTTDQGDSLNGHWRTHHPVIQNGVHTGWGDEMRWGLFAGLTQTSGKVWKRSATEWGFAKWGGIAADPMSQDTVTVEVGGVWQPTPRSSGETIVVTNAAQGNTPASDIFLDFGNLKDWCPAHLDGSFGFGNYLNHCITIQKVDDTKVSGSGRVVGIGSFHSSAPRVTPSNDPGITGLDRGYFYLTKPSVVRLKITQSSMEVLSYFEYGMIPQGRST